MHMIDLSLDIPALVAHAHAQGHNHSRDEDMGYAVHGWLAEAFGDQAPASFRLLDQRHGALRLLGYTDADLVALRERAEIAASPTALSVARWGNSASKNMSTIAWRQGQVLTFEVRACPVVRNQGRERDAFLAALDKEGPDSDRETTYRDWLSRQLREAATLDPSSFSLRAFQLVSVWRKGAPSGSKRVGRGIQRPDALMAGQLTVNDPSSFSQALRRGIGRHRAFGFGMLLLRPA